MDNIQIVAVRCLQGATAQLDQKTAMVTLRIVGDGVWPGPSTIPLKYLATLLPGEAIANCIMEDREVVELTGWPSLYLTTPAHGSPFSRWCVALTIAIQRQCREPVWQGRILSENGRTIELALPWVREDVFRNALICALKHLLFWSNPSETQSKAEQFNEQYRQWVQAAQGGGLAPNTLRFADAAHLRGIPVSVNNGMVRLGWGSAARLLDSSFTDRTSVIAACIAKDKLQTNGLLRAAGLPVPPAGRVVSQSAAIALAAKLGWPVVVKPGSQDQGKGVMTGICSEAQLCEAFAAARKFDPGGVIVEKHIQGDDHRLLVVGGRLLMAIRRTPGGVIGDGRTSLHELLEVLNTDPRRGSDKRSLLIRIELDREAITCLAEQGVTLDSVPAAGCFIRLRHTANISTGGTATDVTSQIHPDNRLLAERAARVIGLDIAGVDFLCPDISRSWREVGGGICEVNAQPGFRPHWLGDPERDINGEIVDWLFKGNPARIPTAAITGTNGKSTVARMLHYIWMIAGKTTGVCTTNGVWIDDDLVSDENLSGFPGGNLLLNDPAVEVAIIEMPRKGLICFGHPCDAYDVAALLNIQDDHIGVDGIDDLDQMARLKAEVLERARQAVVVSAEDPLCLAMLGRAGTPRHILVARDGLSPAIQTHREGGGEAVFIREHQGTPWLVLARGESQSPLMSLRDIPATMNGLLRFNELNALFAVALAWGQGIATDSIRLAMSSFANTPHRNPGRYNVIEGFPFQIMLDYGHNPEGVRELCGVVSKLEVKGKRRLLNLKLGNRHKAHWLGMAPVLAETFATFVLGCDANYVKKCRDYAGDDPIGTMLSTSTDALLTAGVPRNAIIQERDNLQAIRRAVANAQSGDLLVLLAEPWQALPVLDDMRPPPA